MRLPKFEYFEPKDIEEALSIMQNEPAPKILAGGTDLLVNMKYKVEQPPVVVNIKRIAGLDHIRQDNGAIRIGALTTLKRLYSSPLTREKLPAIAAAASAVGAYHHQTMGTLAGNICQQNRCKYFNQSRWWRSSKDTCYKAGGAICHVLNKKEICYSSYCGDMAPVLLVMNAAVVLTGPGSTREIPIEALFSGNGKAPLTLNQGEIVTEIIIAREAMDGMAGYVKFANRGSIDFPIVGTAFWASAGKKEYRIAFTAVDRKPLRGRRVEAFLRGKGLSAEIMKAACALASKEARPVKTSIYPPSFKRRMMGLLLHSAANEAMGRPKK